MYPALWKEIQKHKAGATTRKSLQYGRKWHWSNQRMCTAALGQTFSIIGAWERKRKMSTLVKKGRLYRKDGSMCLNVSLFLHIFLLFKSSSFLKKFFCIPKGITISLCSCNLPFLLFLFWRLAPHTLLQISVKFGAFFQLWPCVRLFPRYQRCTDASK